MFILQDARHVLRFTARNEIVPGVKVITRRFLLAGGSPKQFLDFKKLLVFRLLA
jgi:hypothetical protein